MDSTILADTHHEYTGRPGRALRLFEERGHEITRIAEHVFRVPSCSGEGSYEVLYGGSREECPCPDFEFHGHREPCKHRIAVGVKHAARRSGIRVRTISCAGDPFKSAAKRRAALALAALSDSCAYCKAPEAGHGEQGELCVSCAESEGVL